MGVPQFLFIVPGIFPWKSTIQRATGVPPFSLGNLHIQARSVAGVGSPIISWQLAELRWVDVWWAVDIGSIKWGYNGMLTENEE